MKNRKLKTPDPEMAFAPDCFNLAGEAADDPERLEREARERRRLQAEAEEYQRRQQRTFEQCPGFVGADLPSGPGRAGRVMVEPGRALEAAQWLKRRFHVAESLELSTGNALCFEIRTRQAGKPGPGAQRMPVRFGRPEQFTLDLQV